MLEKAQFDATLEPTWNTCLSRAKDPWPFLAYAWHQSYHTAFMTTPTILVDPKLSILIPLEIHDRTAHFSGGEEIADYLDCVGPESAKVSAWQQTIDYLRSTNVTALHLRNVPQNSETLHYFGTLAAASISKEDTTPIAVLPATFDAYLNTLDRKERHELKRKVRKFDEDYPLASISTKIGTDVDMPLLISLMKTDHNKVEFMTPAMETFFLALPKTIGEPLTQLILTLNDKILASILAFRYKRSLLLYNSSFLREYAGSGFYLKAKAMQWAIEQGVSEYNFLQGSERYKYELGGKDSYVYKIEIII